MKALASIDAGLEAAFGADLVDVTLIIVGGVVLFLILDYVEAELEGQVGVAEASAQGLLESITHPFS